MTCLFIVIMVSFEVFNFDESSLTCFCFMNHAFVVALPKSQRFSFYSQSFIVLALKFRFHSL